jgi:ABC-type multidrug transport system fused ATPase/permease subunit
VDASETQVKRAAKAAQIHDRIETFPDGNLFIFIYLFVYYFTHQNKTKRLNLVAIF